MIGLQYYQRAMRSQEARFRAFWDRLDLLYTPILGVRAAAMASVGPFPRTCTAGASITWASGPWGPYLVLPGDSTGLVDCGVLEEKNELTIAVLYKYSARGALSVSSLTSVGTTATAACANHGFYVGQVVWITGASPISYTGAKVITAASTNAFDYAFSGGTSPATGTITATLADQTLVANTASAGGQDYAFQVNRNRNHKQAAIWGSTVLVTGTATLADGTWYLGAMRRSGASGAWRCDLFLNGLPDGTNNTATNPNGPGAVCQVGQYASAQTLTGGIGMAAIWSRALANGEIAMLSADPLAALRRRLTYFPAVDDFLAAWASQTQVAP